MEYSSSMGIDLLNNEVYIESVLSDAMIEIFHAHKERFSYIDFGAGIYGIQVGRVLDELPTPKDIRDFIGRKVITAKEAREIFDALVRENGNRAYSIWVTIIKVCMAN